MARLYNLPGRGGYRDNDWYMSFLWGIFDTPRWLKAIYKSDADFPMYQVEIELREGSIVFELSSVTSVAPLQTVVLPKDFDQSLTTFKANFSPWYHAIIADNGLEERRQRARIRKSTRFITRNFHNESKLLAAHVEALEAGSSIYIRGRDSKTIGSDVVVTTGDYVDMDVSYIDGDDNSVFGKVFEINSGGLAKAEKTMWAGSDREWPERPAEDLKLVDLPVVASADTDWLTVDIAGDTDFENYPAFAPLKLRFTNFQDTSSFNYEEDAEKYHEWDSTAEWYMPSGYDPGKDPFEKFGPPRYIQVFPRAARPIGIAGDGGTPFKTDDIDDDVWQNMSSLFGVILPPKLGWPFIHRKSTDAWDGGHLDFQTDMIKYAHKGGLFNDLGHADIELGLYGCDIEMEITVSYDWPDEIWKGHVSRRVLLQIARTDAGKWKPVIRDQVNYGLANYDDELKVVWDAQHQGHQTIDRIDFRRKQNAFYHRWWDFWQEHKEFDLTSAP